MQVVLKYLDGGVEKVETVELVSDDNEVFTVQGGIPTQLTVSDIVGKTDYVMFVDEYGLFGLPPCRIVSIERTN